MAKIYDRSGKEASVSEWQQALQTANNFYAVVEVNGDDINIFTRFSGIEHGTEGEKKTWELGVTGNPANAEHTRYHRAHELFTSEVDAEARYDAVVSAITGGRDL